MSSIWNLELEKVFKFQSLTIWEKCSSHKAGFWSWECLNNSRRSFLDVFEWRVCGSDQPEQAKSVVIKNTLAQLRWILLGISMANTKKLWSGRGQACISYWLTNLVPCQSLLCETSFEGKMSWRAAEASQPERSRESGGRLQVTVQVQLEWGSQDLRCHGAMLRLRNLWQCESLRR